MDYRNPASCLSLLQKLQTHKVDECHTVLSDMVAGLLEALPAPNQHLEVLEAARPAIAQIQAALSQHYAGHPLPPDSEGNANLLRVVALWRNLSRSYAQIARHDAQMGTLDDQRALLGQRRVHYAASILIEYFRAHRAVPHGVWTEIHESFAAAEQTRLASARVADPLNALWKAQSAMEAYVAILLIDLANPFGRTGQELQLICRWAQRFAPYCTLGPMMDGLKPTSYGLDLASDHGLRPVGLMSSGNMVRRFDSEKLAGQIRAVFNQFKQGVSPASLGLGEEATLDMSARLLISLYRPWGLSSAGRRFPRHGSRGEIELCGDWLAIGFHIQGRLFEQPRSYGIAGSLKSDISLLTFGERAPEATERDGTTHRQRQLDAERLGLVCERWSLLDQSVGGFRLRQRPHAERLEHQQLVGIRPLDGEYFLLAQVSWLMYRDDGMLEAGTHVLRGIPEVVGARPLAPHPGQRELYQQAFLIPAHAKLKVADTTLVLPGGWYHPNRVIEVTARGHTVQVRLTGQLIKGANFDHVSFETLAPEAE
ncbi:hypothetical protein [Parazoarcus communis]|uniref:Molecular chaperone n=1 Tax=Parazoarcus communis SWub3 = DSM 12120 TaxID=1121029 RepID=A0A323UZ80_9RHOO|nr:hypothetical protein [Parazoarcus communis]NMG68768.1 hypothetical protein [Parazoarcus communis SWub3 = DSM 12120]PZA17889.1 hypothetical protein DNK49_05050 [Azoarcus communis] [Parazoarcus communis SWub3 = DSM 12120]